jgi:ATP-dependent Lhr-like helicase
LWTFSGTRTNRTLARGLPGAGRAPRFDALKVEWEGPPDLVLNACWNAQPATAEETATLGKAVKFHDLVPAGLLGKLLSARLWTEVQPEALRQLKGRQQELKT